MKKNTKKNANKKTITAKKLAKLEADKIKKQKKREAAKAKRVKLLEKHRAKIEANKQKRAEKKAKKLAKLEKQRAKKLAIREKKRLARQKKLERLAKQKAKAKEMKLKAKAKAKAQKLKMKNLEKKREAKKENAAPVAEANGKIDVKDAVKTIKTYAKQLAKTDDHTMLDAAKTLGFIVNDDNVILTIEAKRKAAKTKKQKIVEPIIEPEVAEPDDSFDSIPPANLPKPDDDIAELANVLENDDTIETPVGDTYADNVNVDQPNDFDDDADDTIDDNRDETDEDKISFRQEWNNEFGENGENSDNI